VKPLVDQRLLKGMAHITGGGLTDNIPRVLPSGLDARIDRRSWTIPPLFEFLIQRGRLDILEASQALNLGIGMVLIASKGQASEILKLLNQQGSDGFIIGELIQGEGRVQYIH
jgi:phosphoribosylformylglycinamidine cyclo-ligase